MINENDRLPLDKPQPMRNTDWILLGILILLLALTFPFLWWMYYPLIWIMIRYILPVAAVVFIGYFAVRALQLGETNQGEGTFSGNVSKIWNETILLIRKYFKTVMITAILATLIFVGSAIIYTKLSRKAVTEKQLAKMSQALARHKNELGSYPADLAGLVGNDPLKREWYHDSWGNAIDYTVTKNGAGFQLISPGADGVKGSEDDLSISI